MALAVLTACDRTPGAETVYYTVTFDSRGGSEVPSQRIEKGKTAQKPADPAREGYTFDGWFDGETEYDFTKAVEKNFTLSAKWTEVPAVSVYYTVRFMDGANEYKSAKVESGKPAQRPRKERLRVQGVDTLRRNGLRLHESGDRGYRPLRDVD